jgi:3',5'-cyclic-AMP phosphodiesterase
MPVHAMPLSRRSFLTRAVAGSASLALLKPAWADAPLTDPNQLALLADTHIPNSPDVEARGTNMTGNLRQVVGELVGLKTKPAGVLINGDCAYLKGLPEDYANLAACVAPLSEAGLPLHMTMGNHDDRSPLYAALTDQKPQRPLVDSKHVSIVSTPHANLFLLDTLSEVNVVTGELGAAQRKWLARALDAHAEKPAVIIAHHNPQFTAPAEGGRWTGIKDTADFFELIGSRRHVKAYVFGHSHNWSISQRDDLHLINLPPVAYVFGEGKPNGWVQADLRENGITLRLHTINADHPQNGETVNLTWR